jgi:dTDP-glucose 4,6-dehydratase
MSKRVLLTGACGFIGSHFVEAILKTTDWEIVGLDRIDETSSLERILDTDAYAQHSQRFRFLWHDLRAPINESVARAIGHVDLVFHLAASTHVDRSITDAATFVMDNVLGTCHLLEWARRMPLELFVHFSTDEVFGPAPAGWAFHEHDPFRPANPYAASKAAAVELADSYRNTHKIPILTTFCMNAIGERQHPEKYVPLLVKRILRGVLVTIHADPSRTHPARRSYIHARNIWNAIRFLIDQPRHVVVGERFNITGERELDCLELAQMVAKIIGKPLYHELVDFHSERPGHDLRYALSGDRLAKLGFVQPVSFEASLEHTVKWFVDNPEWLLMRPEAA